MSSSLLSPDELYRRYAPAAYRRAQRLLGSASDGEEVVHDVFVTLFEHPEHQQQAVSLSAYLYGAVTHACLNRLRNQRTRYRLAVEHQATAFASTDLGTSAEIALAARALLANLPLQLAQVAVYYHLDELSQREIAEMLGCSRRHVGNLLNRLSQWVNEQEKQSCQR